MRLLFTLTSYLPAVGGAQYLQHMLAKSLRPRHEVQVVSQWDSNRTDWLLGTTLTAPSQPRDYLADGIPVHRLGLSWAEKARLLPFIPLAYPLPEASVPAIGSQIALHILPFARGASLIHNVRIGREALTEATWLTARRCGIPFAITPVHHPRWGGWRHRYYRELYRKADLVVALTRAERASLVSMGVDEGRVIVTGMGPVLAEEADPNALASKYGVHGPIVLFVGQHFEYKGYVHLLQAMTRIWPRFPDATFVFIGPAVGHSDSVFRRFSDPRVLRLGTVDLQEKTNALAACQVLCVPSVQESFGGVYTEAWSFGKPVVGCRIPAVSEVVTDGIDGILVEQDPPEIADAICQLLGSSSLAGKMGEAGRKKVEEKYTWKKLATLTERAYYQVLGSTPPPSTSSGGP